MPENTGIDRNNKKKNTKKIYYDLTGIVYKKQHNITMQGLQNINGIKGNFEQLLELI